MAFSPLSGYVASVKISTTSYAFDKFSISEENNLADVTTFLSSGAQVLVPGTYKATIKCSGVYDQGNMTAFVPGDDISLILEFTSGTELTVPVLVKNCNINVDVKDAQRVDVEFWTTGSFTLGPL